VTRNWSLTSWKVSGRVRVDLGYRVPVSGGGRQNERRSSGLISRALGSIATCATQYDTPVQTPAFGNSIMSFPEQQVDIIRNFARDKEVSHNLDRTPNV